MLYWKIFFLSLIQGFTEFIPVSSTAHLIIFGKFFSINEGFILYQSIIQLASILVIFVFFRKKLFKVIFSLHKNKNSRNFSYKIILAFLPCLITGFLFYKYIKAYCYTNLIIALMLIFWGIIFLIIDKIHLKSKYNDIDKMTLLVAFKIGFYQIFSLIPGVSRSGSTIIGGLLSNLSKETAVEFSFLLAIPTLLAASVYDIYTNVSSFNYIDIKLMIFAFITTFLVSMFTIKLFLSYINTHDFKVFGYYRIILGLIIIIINL
ncbi:MAG TPA: undecaprenyl-diphosphate phosphatase [Rickettsiales bacterium]|nr:undecaprenyl-diphosphate phosphatase [Rickettsiales bacterium]